MAFVQPVSLPARGSAARRSVTKTKPSAAPSAASTPARARKAAPRATATSGASSARRRASAPVIDLRVSTRLEAHHWISVRTESCRVFERAAVAQADVTRQLEKRAAEGAQHRWVLRETSNASADARYVVMESFDRVERTDTTSSDTFRGLTRRWLSAVERVGPLVDAGETRTLHYDNVFTAKRHDVTFDPHANVVVLESHAVADTAGSTVLDALKAAAETSVATGRCLEFCVLRNSHDDRLFKTVQVYRDADAMKEQTRRLDGGFLQAVRAHSPKQSPSRTVFKPVIFA